jgi:flagellar hook-associated protein 3 FlgL
MALVSLGDMAQTFLLRRQTVVMKEALQARMSEVTTGQATDLAAQVKGDFSALSGIDATLARLDGYKSAGVELGLMADGMQMALSTLGNLAMDIVPQLLISGLPSSTEVVDVVAADAAGRFDSAILALNAQVAGRSLFAGQATDGAALAGPEAILAALDGVIAGAVSPADVEAAVTGWFDDPAGYAAQAYRGGAPLAGVAIAEGDAATLDFTAMAPAVRDVLKGLAMAALLDRGALAGFPAGRADLARRAGERLHVAEAGRAEMAGRIGIAQAQIAQAGTRNAAEATALGIARTGIVTVDPYEAATRLQQTQAQLETIYALTARLSRLTLMDFLK